MKKLLLIMLCLGLFIPALNCATIFDGPKSEAERTGNIQWGYFVLDLLFFWPGIIIDFGNGAIYERKAGTRSEIEQDLKDHILKGMPCYIVRNDGCYKVELTGSNLKYSKIAQNEIPATVWQAIEREKVSLLTAK